MYMIILAYSQITYGWVSVGSTQHFAMYYASVTNLLGQNLYVLTPAILRNC